MPVTVELHFERPFVDLINDVWRKMEEKRYSTGAREFFGRPHLTVGMVDDTDTDKLADEVSGIARRFDPFDIVFPACGCFGANPGVVFLSPVTTFRLLEINRFVTEALDRGPGKQADYYRSGSWTPHCTIAVDLEAKHLRGVFSLFSDRSSAPRGLVTELSICRYPGGRLVKATPLGADSCG